ncbi:hypothetical protein C8Q79DRAFT_678931 [Trametes meyenii]|nr:hypothetical protein C8Q79DRAFT_678931 [Trametes meyenii]
MFLNCHIFYKHPPPDTKQLQVLKNVATIPELIIPRPISLNRRELPPLPVARTHQRLQDCKTNSNGVSRLPLIMLRLIHLINETHWEFLEVDDPGTVTYAILSHVWSRAGCVSGSSPEPTYEDLVNTKDFLSPTQKDPRFYKLREFCKTAWRHKYSFVWADMCCIQKSSSAELSEALTSMYYWYRCADICYAYLEDVQVCPNSKGHHPSHPENLPSSLWFERGWTLQELIAPRYLVFYSQNWSVIGSKYHLARYISSITRIPPEVLTHEKDVHTFSVASRMSWAAYRRTTRPEDRAYSLMGLFGVQIPVQYGEGSYAFIRLQEEILRRIPDPTLFAWGTALSYDSLPTPGVTHIVETNTELHVRNPFPSDSRQRHRYLLAASPDDFQYSGLGPGHSPEPEHSDAPGPIVIAPQRSQMRGGGPPSAAIDSFHVLPLSCVLGMRECERRAPGASSQHGNSLEKPFILGYRPSYAVSWTRSCKFEGRPW